MNYRKLHNLAALLEVPIADLEEALVAARNDVKESDIDWEDFQKTCSLKPGDIIEKEKYEQMFNAYKASKARPIGKKYDENKHDWTLLPWEALGAVIEVMQYGADKYGRDNWKHVDPPSRYMAAAFRHLIAHQQGARADPESGLAHLAHAATNVLFMLQRHTEGETI